MFLISFLFLLVKQNFSISFIELTRLLSSIKKLNRIALDESLSFHLKLHAFLYQLDKLGSI